MSTTSSIAHHHPADPVHEHHVDGHHDDHGPDKGWRRWAFATNHKDIGTMYLLFSLLMFFIGGTMAMVIRAELFQPGMQLVDPMFFNQMTTMHALIMIFGAVMPAFVGLANWMIPLMVGAPDMALPRMNNSARITIAMAPPTKNISRLNSMYSVPISLWLVANTQRRQPLAGP